MKEPEIVSGLSPMITMIGIMLEDNRISSEVSQELYDEIERLSKKSILTTDLVAEMREVVRLSTDNNRQMKKVNKLIREYNDEHSAQKFKDKQVAKKLAKAQLKLAGKTSADAQKAASKRQ